MNLPIITTVFVGYDLNGIPRHAHKRGTVTSNSYKGNVAGSQPEFSFHWHGTSDKIFLFEAPIDMLSFISMHKENWKNPNSTSGRGFSQGRGFELSVLPCALIQKPMCGKIQVLARRTGVRLDNSKPHLGFCRRAQARCPSEGSNRTRGVPKPGFCRT